MKLPTLTSLDELKFLSKEQHEALIKKAARDANKEQAKMMKEYEKIMKKRTC